MPSDKPTILEEIVEKKLDSFSTRFSFERFKALEEKIASGEKPRSFYQSLCSTEKWSLIAEIKARSPSKGTLVSKIDPAEWGARYERCGAHAISIVTEENFFNGTLDWIHEVKKKTKLPILRKDFLTTPEEILESRAMGADAVLLIVAILTKERLQNLVQETLNLGMEPFVEAHDQEEALLALDTQTRIIGVNNRDLRDFSVNLETTKRLTPFIHERNKEILAVCESGIFSSKEIQELYPCGVKSFLVGEAILTSPNPDKTLADLLS